ncbi:MAG: carboxypeptidase-like regulatory domain-containing protein, partial [Flavobacteriaceae bacterium]
NKPIPYVNIYIENSYTGTTSNDNGDYVLALSKPGTYTIVFQFLGYQTQTNSIDIKQFPDKLNITLLEENISLNEVVINANENPANRIVRAAIKK